MRDWTIDEFLTRLASRSPAPGGGASAALHASQGAALLAMVGRYSDGPSYASHAALVGRVVAEADRLRETSLRLAAEDASAFAAVAEAYRMPKGTAGEKDARKAAIAAALVGAIRPPLEVLDVARTLLGLAEDLLPVGNRNVVTDIAAAAEAIRAAAATARVNVEVNLAGIADPAVRTESAATLSLVDDLLARADRVTAAVRRELSS